MKKKKQYWYIICIVLCIVTMLSHTPTMVAYAAPETTNETETEKEEESSTFGSLIDKESSEYKKIYGVTTDDASKVEGEEENADKPGWIQTAISTVFGLIGQAGNWILSLLGISIDGVVLGRMSTSGVELSKYFQFDMVDGNYAITFSAKVYGALRSYLFFFVLVGYLLILAKYSMKSATPQVINNLKDKLVWIIITLFLLLALPNIVEILLLIRDSLSYGVINFLTGGKMDNLNIVKWSAELWGDKKTFANCLVYIASVGVTGWFVVVYFVLTWMTAFLFSISPLVLVVGIYDKSVWKRWLSMFLGNILCVFVDRLLLCVPSLFVLNTNKVLDMNTLLRIGSCGIIIPVRTKILNLLNFNMSYSGLGTAMSAMQAAKDIAKGSGKFFKNAMKSLKNTKENYDDFKSDKQRAKEELELAKAEGSGVHGIEDSYKKFEKPTGLENFFKSKDSTKKPFNLAKDKQEQKQAEEDGQDEQSKKGKDSNKSMGANIKTDEATISAKDIKDSLDGESDGLEKTSHKGINSLGINNFNTDTSEDLLQNNDIQGQNENPDFFRNESFSSNKRLDNMIKREKTAELMDNISNENKAIQEENRGLEREQQSIFQDMSLKNNAYSAKKQELEKKLNKVNADLANPNLPDERKAELSNERNNIKSQMKAADASYKNETQALQGRLADINNQMSSNKAKLQNNAKTYQALEADYKGYNQKEQMYSNMSGAVKASNSKELEMGLKKQQIMNKYVNSDNFDASRYQSALSHEQKATLYYERAKRKKHNLIVSTTKDVGKVAATAIGGVSGAMVGAGVGMAVNMGNPAVSVIGTSMVGRAGAGAGNVAGSAAGYVVGQVLSGVVDSIDEANNSYPTNNFTSGSSNGNTPNNYNSNPNSNSNAPNNEYENTSYSESQSTYDASYYTLQEVEKLKVDIEQQNLLQEHKQEQQMKNAKRAEKMRDAEIKKLLNTIVTDNERK